jgi:addiction module HigA family antidote
MHNPPHPGELVREATGDTDVTEFAAKLGVSRVTLSRLLNGKAGISAQMALSLADVLQSSAEMWMGMQSQFDLWQVRAALRKPKSARPSSDHPAVEPPCAEVLLDFAKVGCGERLLAINSYLRWNLN